MSDDVLDCFSLDQLEKLRDKREARNDRAGADAIRAAIGRRGAVQTDELSRSGKLFAHKTVMNDDSGRTMTTWTGDSSVWMRAFQTGPIVGSLNRELLDEAKSGKPQTVRLRHGERISIIKD